jgi:hypothetical protein
MAVLAGVGHRRFPAAAGPAENVAEPIPVPRPGRDRRCSTIGAWLLAEDVSLARRIMVVMSVWFAALARRMDVIGSGRR